MIVEDSHRFLRMMRLIRDGYDTESPHGRTYNTCFDSYQTPHVGVFGGGPNACISNREACMAADVQGTRARPPLLVTIWIFLILVCIALRATISCWPDDLCRLLRLEAHELVLPIHAMIVSLFAGVRGSLVNGRTAQRRRWGCPSRKGAIDERWTGWI